ncbi:MAG: RNA recognition motif domain-containing protein [Candidatus Binatia bacterium]
MRLYVGNLSSLTDEAALKSAFAAHGEVTSVEIVRDRRSQKSKGFGFVEMPQAAEAAGAIGALHETLLDGNRLAVDKARPRREGGLLP